MNHFLALRPDGATRDRLHQVAERLRAWDLPATWTHPEDYHLTVLYLGDLDETAASWIAPAIADVAASIRQPSLQLAGLGASGTRGQTVPRTVYAAALDQAGMCYDLHRDLCDCLDDQPQTHFTPHLTICRPQPVTRREQAAAPLFRDWPHLLEANGQADWGACVVEALVLYRSTTRTPRYAEVTRWRLD